MLEKAAGTPLHRLRLNPALLLQLLHGSNVVARVDGGFRAIWHHKHEVICRHFLRFVWREQNEQLLSGGSVQRVFVEAARDNALQR